MRIPNHKPKGSLQRDRMAVFSLCVGFLSGFVLLVLVAGLILGVVQ